MDDRRIRPVPLRDFKPPQINVRKLGLLILVFLAVIAVTSIRARRAQVTTSSGLRSR